MALHLMEKMPVGQLLVSLASVHSAMGKPLRENIDVSLNETPLLNVFTWAFNSSMDLDLPPAHAKGRGDEDAENVDLATGYYNGSTPADYPDPHNGDSLSIMWYLASFGALVMFFLLISFSEVCCKKSFALPPEEETEVSPPPYDLFAPPTYDSLYAEKKDRGQRKKKRRKCEVFVIHVFGDKSASRVAPLEVVQRGEPGQGQPMTPPPPP